MIKLSDYVFQFLEKHGIKQAFMLPGGGAMHLDDSIGRSGISYTCFLHEQGAAIAAEAYGQHTNTPGLVLVTSGPGATNAITGVTAGWIDSTPMIVISGQSKRSDLVGDKGVRQIGSQEVQIIPMVKPITKYAVQILEPNEIKYHLERAYQEAVGGRPGPVWLDIPLDVQAVMVDEHELMEYIPEQELAEDSIDEAVNKAYELIKESRKPLVIAGNGIKLAGGTNILYELLKMLKIPVETTWKTIDMFGETEEEYVGHPGIMGDRGANLILQEADLILSVGCRLDTSVTAFNDKNFGKNAKKIIVDIDANEIKRMDVNKEVAVACDAKMFLKKLLKKAELENKQFIDEKNRIWTQWRRYCKEVRKKYPVITAEHANAIEYVSAYYFIGKLCELLKEDDVIVPESSGGAGEITYQAFQLKRGQKMKNAAGLGSMGFGLPYAIGACIANDRRRTILINGDGAFQLNIQELETLHRLHLPVKMFIWSNNGYASIRSMQRNNFEGRYVASEENSGLTMPDISKVASAYGFKTCRICDNKELDLMLPKIMENDEAILCEIMVLPEETVSPRVKAIVGENGQMTSGPLERMWPYIDEQ